MMAYLLCEVMFVYGFYKFERISDLLIKKNFLFNNLNKLNVKGTILISNEEGLM